MFVAIVLLLFDCPLWGSYKEVKHAKRRFCGGSREARPLNTDTAAHQIQAGKMSFSLADLGSRSNQLEVLKMLVAEGKANRAQTSVYALWTVRSSKMRPCTKIFDSYHQLG